MSKFRRVEFALLQGQIVEIIEVRDMYSTVKKYYETECRIKLLNDTLTHWVKEGELVEIENQTALKVLFSNKSK